MNEFSKRLQQALDLRHINAIDLAKKTKIGKSSISQYLSGKYMPKQTNIYKMADALHVNPEWLSGRDAPIEATKYTPAKVAMDKYHLYLAALDALGWEEATINADGKNIFEAFDNDEDDECDRYLLTNGRNSFEVSIEDQQKFEDDLINFVADRIQKLMVKAAESIKPKG